MAFQIWSRLASHTGTQSIITPSGKMHLACALASSSGAALSSTCGRRTQPLHMQAAYLAPLYPGTTHTQTYLVYWTATVASVVTCVRVVSTTLWARGLGKHITHAHTSIGTLKEPVRGHSYVCMCVHGNVGYVLPALYVLPTHADLPPTHVSWPLPTASRPPTLTNMSQPPQMHHGPHRCIPIAHPGPMAPMHPMPFF